MMTRLDRLKSFWQRMPEAFRWGSIYFLVARGVLWIWGVLVMALLPYFPNIISIESLSPLPGGVINSLLAPWFRHDVFWFVRIAIQGYGVADGRGAFSPLYPLSIKTVGMVLGEQYSLAAWSIANVSCWLSLIIIYDFAQRDIKAGKQTLFVLLLYPYAFFLFVPYNESVQLLMILMAFWSARDGRWWLAGISGALAVLTKITALALLPALIVQVWLQRSRQSVRHGLWLLLLPLAAVGWIIVRQFLQGGFGSNFFSPLLSGDFQAGWNEQVTWPWDGLFSAILAPFRLWPGSYTAMAVINLLAVLAVIYLVMLTYRLRNWAYLVYSVTLLVMNFMLVVQYVPLLDLPRRMLIAFPTFIAAAVYWPQRGRRLIVLGAIGIQLTLSALFIKWVLIG